LEFLQISHWKLLASKRRSTYALGTYFVIVSSSSLTFADVTPLDSHMCSRLRRCCRSLLYSLVAIWSHSSLSHRQSSILPKKSSSMETDNLSSKNPRFWQERGIKRLRSTFEKIQRNPPRSLGASHMLHLIIIAYFGAFHFWIGPLELDPALHCMT
jgi:hypothetical protein